MKKQIFSTLLFSSFFSLSFFSQKESGSCSHLKRFENQHAKSNTFNQGQIAETEKYNVHFYFLDLNMTNTTTALSGSSEMQATCNVNLDSALLEFFPTFTISFIEVDGNPTAYSRVGSALKVPVNKTTGQNFSVKVFYNGTPPNASTNPLGGSGMTNDNSSSWGNSVTWSLSEPFSAFEWFPVKQHLKDKADSCAVWITVPSACKAGSNGVLENITDFGATKRFEWKHRHPIDYYLISVAVAEYVDYTITANPVGYPQITIQNYIYNNPATLPNFQADIDETADFIELYSELFGMYPFTDEKYGHCMAPLGGGMEHQTMTTQGFFNPTLTAHELGHQWWGDNVTCGSWADIWVNEGFASYAEYLMLEALYPGDEVTQMADVHTNVKSQPGGSVWCEDSLSDASIFSSRLSYDKGAAIIHQVRYIMNNDSLFFATLKNYQTTFAEGTALGVDFFQICENVSGINFTDYAEQWYFGEGFPTYSVIWNNVGSDVLVKISHSVSAGGVTPTFTNPIDLLVSRTALPDTVYRFDITSNATEFVLANASEITNITAIDPNNWIINNAGSIVKNPNYLTINEEMEVSNYVSLYPNPSLGNTTIETSLPGQNELVVIDTKGRILKKVNFENSIEVNFTNEVAGIYTIQVRNENTGQVTRKLFKKN